MAKRYSVAVDFDGVIHSYTSPWIEAHVIPDPPVEGAIKWLEAISETFDIVIFTTRGKTEEGRTAVAKWIVEQGYCGHDFEVTAEKPPCLIYLDDRAYRFEGPGTFPTADDIHRARPWNKRTPETAQPSTPESASTRGPVTPGDPGYFPEPSQPGSYVVELLVVVEADSFTDAEALGERAARQAWKASTPRSAGTARIVNVIVSDVRSGDD